MPNSSILDVAIGLAFIYLFLCLICSKVQEWLATWFQNRSRLLRETITALIGKDLSHQLYKDPFIEELKSSVETNLGKPEKDSSGRLGTDRRDPSYIDPPTFVLALLRVLVADYPTTPAAALAPPPAPAVGGSPTVVASSGDAPPTFLTYRQAVVAAKQDAENQATQRKADNKKAEMEQAQEKGHLLSVILTLMDEVISTTMYSTTGPTVTVTADLDAAKKRLEDWYTNTMDRATGVYKRHVQVRLILIAGIVSLLLNADSLHMAERLWQEPVLTAKIVTAAQEAVHQSQTSAPTPPAPTPPAPTPPAPIPPAPIPPAPTPPAAQTISPDLADKILQKGQNLPLPLGWQTNLLTVFQQPPPDLLTRIFWKLIGLLVTVIALTLGAPFWFDTLNRLVNLRGTGPRPDPNNKTTQKTTTA